MSNEKVPVLVLDLQLTGWERSHGPYRRVLMTRDEFITEANKVAKRLSLVKKLLASRSGLTNRERRTLQREKKYLAEWLRSRPMMVLLDRPSWGSEEELRIVKVWSGARSSKARDKKLRWLARKHPSWMPSWVSEAELHSLTRKQGKAEKSAD